MLILGSLPGEASWLRGNTMRTAKMPFGGWSVIPSAKIWPIGIRSSNVVLQLEREASIFSDHLD